MAVSKDFMQLSSREQSKLGLAEGFKLYSPFPFGGMNQKDSRLAIEDNQFFWQENFIKVGNGYLRTLYDAGTPLFTSTNGKKILSFFWFNINATQYVAIFFTDGTAIQVAGADGSVTTISNTAGLFFSGNNYPACCQSGAQYLLISNNNSVNSYWIWDGKVLYSAGSLGPAVTITNGGSGYISPPTVTAYGGSGSGATFQAFVNAGSVISVQLLTPGTGYQPTDQVQLAFSGGGGSTSAQLHTTLVAGTISSVVINAGGSGYTSPPAVSFSSGSATATAVLGPLGVGAIAVTAGGTGYGSPPNVVITGGGGTGATATATLSGTSVNTITVTNAGTGYTSLPTVTLTGGGGSGATAAATVLSGPVGSVTITNGGSGYTSTPNVSFTGGGGSGAQGVAVLSAGAVASVVVDNPGSGYTSTPTLTFVGGGGSGATATAVLTADAITSVTLTNGGTGYTSPPAVVVQNSATTAAAATVQLMPFGISGSALEQFQNRVWLINPFQLGAKFNGGVINVSAPASLVDFATSDGGLIFTSSDRFLRAQYVNIRQSNGYLYPLGDSSVSVISNVQSGANSTGQTTTVFNYQNTDPQIGIAWRDSCQDFSRTMLFANSLGVFGLYGGAVTKVSKQIDEIFNAAIFPPNPFALTPTAAVTTLFNMKTYLILMTIFDPTLAKFRNVMLGWDEQDWFVISQTPNLIYIGTQEVSSSLTAWGTDGTSLYPLLAQPSATLQKRLVSKLYGGQNNFIVKSALAFYTQVQDRTANQAGVSINVKIDTEATSTNLPIFPVALSAPAPASTFYGTTSGDIYGVQLGLEVTTTSPDFSFWNMSLAYLDWRGVY